MTAPADFSPFVGLRPFERDDSLVYFGRSEQVRSLLSLLSKQRFLAVVGSSGCGKSSLVRAGLIPALEGGFLVQDRDRWRIAALKPGEAPVGHLAKALIELAGTVDPQDAEGDLIRERERPDGSPAQDLATRLTEEGIDTSLEILAAANRAGQTNFLLLVDQFEELFRFGLSGGDPRAREQAETFAALLLRLSKQQRLPIYVCTTMRSDFLGDCDAFVGLPEAINAGQFLVPRLTRAQRRQAIEGPVRLAGGTIAPRLVDRLLNENLETRDDLPILQHLLMRVWDAWSAAPDGPIDLEHYDRVHGIHRALHSHAEEALKELEPVDQVVARSLFQTCTELDFGNRRVRRPAHLSEVAVAAEVSVERVMHVIDCFRSQGRNFLVLSSENPADDPVIDISHESLIRQWQTLSDWVDEEAAAAKLYRRLAATADRWQQGTGALWVDPDLELGLRWREQTRPDARWAARYGGDFDVAMAFLDTGQAQRAQRREQAEAKRRLALRRARVTALAAVIGLAVVAGAAAWGWIERQSALASELRRTQDLFDSGLTHAALLARTEDYAGAGRLLTKTRELDAEIPATRRLARDLSLRLAQILGGAPDGVYDGAGAPLSQALISPDGTWVSACGERGTLVLFDAASGALLHRLTGHDPDAQIRDCVFDPKGRWLASAGDDGHVILWSLPTGGRPPAPLRQWAAPGAVMALAVDPAGRLLASGGDDGTISLWDPQTGTQLLTLRGHRDRISEVTGLDISPDGGRLASASYDGTARLWDLATGLETGRLTGHGAAVKGVAFSADGRYLASAGDDQRVILWDTQDMREVQVFAGHRNAIYGVAFAERTDEPNAAPLLIAGGFDRTARIWDTASAVTLRLLQGHSAAVNGIDVQGNALYTASSDGTVRRWTLSLPHQRLLDLPAEPASTAISPDGRLLAVGFANGALRLYALPGLTDLVDQPDAHAEEVQRLAFSPDGSLLASAGFDGMARLWRVSPAGVLTATSTGPLAPLHRLTGHTDAVHAVAFSPDGSLVATAGYDGRIGVFDTASGEGELIASTEGQVLSVGFDPTGRLIYAADRDDRQVQVWDVGRRPPRLERVLAASRDLLMWAEPDVAGNQLAVVGRDYVVAILDALDGRMLHSLPRHENAVFKARFLPGGEQLATAGVDATVRLWDLPTETELFALRLPTNQGRPVPLWDFDLRCTPTGCWLAVPLTRGKLAVYDLGEPAVP